MMRSFDPSVIPEAVRLLSGWLCVPGPSLWAGGDQHHIWYWTRAMPGMQITEGSQQGPGQ